MVFGRVAASGRVPRSGRLSDHESFRSHSPRAWDWLAAKAGYRVSWWAKDADSLLMRATNPYFAEGRDVFTLNGSSGTNWANIGTNTYRHTTGTTTALQQAGISTTGKLYKTVYTIANRTAGTLTDAAGNVRSTNDSFTTYHIATGTGFGFAPTSTFDGDVTITEYKQIDIRPSTDFDPTLGRLQLVTNGGFDWDVAWTKAATCVITGGKAVLTAAAVGSPLNQPAVSLNIGKQYDLTFTISNYVSGSIRIAAGSGGTGTVRSGNGTFTETLTCTTTAVLQFLVTVIFTGDIDNVSVVPHDSLLVFNGDGSTTTGWTALNSAALSVVSSRLRVTNGGTANPAAEQLNLITGRRYRATGSFNGDGTNVATIRNSGTVISTSSASATPQNFEFTFIAIANSLRLCQGIVGANNAGGYAEFANIVIIEINPLDGVLVNGVTVLNGEPSALGGKALVFDGVNDLVNIYSAELNSLFTPEKFWLAGVGKMAVPNDATSGSLARIVGFSNDEVRLRKLSASVATIYLTASGTITQSTPHNGNPNAFLLDHIVDVSGLVENGGYNGVPFGMNSTPEIMRVNLNSNGCVIGASVVSTNTNPWNGNIYGVALLNYAPTNLERFQLAVLLGVVN